MSRRLRLAFALVALAAGLVNLALLLRLRTRHDLEAPFAETLLATLGVSWSFVAAGLVAWARRPGNRTGALMVAAGLAFSLNGLALIHTAAAFALWYLVASLPAATLGHLLAVFPDGRATTPLQRVFLLANYATTAPLALVQLSLADAAALGCGQCPPALLGIGGRHVRARSEAVLAVSNLIVVAVVVLLLGIVVARWRRAPTSRRRSLAPVALVGVVLVALFLTRQALMAVVPRSPAPLAVGFDLAIVATLLLWPLAFLAGLVRSRLDRSAVGDLAVELSQPLPPGRLEQALARVLHDPTLNSPTGCQNGTPSSMPRDNSSNSLPAMTTSRATAPSRCCGTMAMAAPSPSCSITPPSTTIRGWSGPSQRLPRWRSRTSGSMPSFARSLRRSALPAPGSSSSVTPSGAASNGTSTMAPSSAW